MRRTGIAAAIVAAFGLSACSTITSYFHDSDSPAPVHSSNDPAAGVGRVVYVGTERPLVNDLEKPPTPSDQLIDIRMDNGDLRTVIQPASGDVRLGDRVRLADGRIHRN